MEIVDIYEHLSCYCYDSSEHPIVELMELNKKEEGEQVVSDNKIIFLLEGNLCVELHGEPKIIAEKGDFVFASIGMPIRYKAMKNSIVMLVTINGNLRLCRGLELESLYVKNKHQRSLRNGRRITTLKMNKMLWGLVSGLNMAVTHKLMCKQYFEVKIQEFFILLRAFYTKEELRDFFYHVLSPNTVFSEFVKSNWLTYNTVQGLSDAMNLSTLHFAKKFKAVFGMPPGKWLLEEKSQYILEDIQGSDKTFQQIAADYGFATVSNFNRFCKTRFGETANEIRHKSCKVMK